MITNISIVSVFVKDVDESKKFYTDVLGFQEKDDITLGDGYRWCTVVHPNQPELNVSLSIPGPPHSPELVAAMKRAQEDGTMHGLGLNVDDCQKTYEELQAKGSSSCSRRRSGPTEPRPSAATTQATGSCSSSRARGTPRRTSSSAQRGRGARQAQSRTSGPIARSSSRP